MKAKEALKELKAKSVAELSKLLSVNREKMRELNFKIAQEQYKNVREVRAIKKKIAQLLTLINSQKKK